MTREEASIILKNMDRILCDDDLNEAFDIAIEALDQEPCDDDYIKVPKKAMKYVTKGMVAYNYEWLREHFDIERLVVCGEQQPCEDAISRQAVLDVIDRELFKWDVIDEIRKLPPVNPQIKTEALDEIRAEIEQTFLDNGAIRAGVSTALNIIDKYRESEE